jgi:nucleoside-diphosphate-sugar epimerase
MKTKILILGSDGYIGCRVYEHLILQGLDVIGVDTGWFGIVNDKTVLCDYNTLTKSFIEQFTHIICLSSHSSVSMCSNNNVSCLNNNVVNFINLLEKINDTQKLIYASSLAIYGNNPNLVTEKDDLPNPVDMYDYSLVSREFLIRLYNKNTIGLRFGTVGGFSKNFRGENLINSLSYNSIINKKITISNPNAYRAVLGMTDLCKAIDNVVKSDICGNRIYNLSSVNNTIIGFGEEIQKLTNSELVVNNTFQTKYSFRSSSELFSNDFNFKFNDSIESIFNEIKNNIDQIKFKVERNKINYV